jgi:hypothetical protein
MGHGCALGNMCEKCHLMLGKTFGTKFQNVPEAVKSGS